MSSDRPLLLPSPRVYERNATLPGGPERSLPLSPKTLQGCFAARSRPLFPARFSPAKAARGSSVSSGSQTVGLLMSFTLPSSFPLVSSASSAVSAWDAAGIKSLARAERAEVAREAGLVGARGARGHRCERSLRHDGTAGRNRWRPIQIRSPRGGDGVVPETAAGRTPGAGQCVAISRPAV